MNLTFISNVCIISHQALRRGFPVFLLGATIDSLRSTTSTSARTSGLSRRLGLGRRPK